MAAPLWLRRSPIGAELRQWGDSRCHRLEACLPLGGGGVQDFTRGFSRRPRKALPAESKSRHGMRALLSGGARPAERFRIADELGLAGNSWQPDRNGQAVQQRSPI